jgi:hypothetical protein
MRRRRRGKRLIRLWRRGKLYSCWGGVWEVGLTLQVISFRFGQTKSWTISRMFFFFCQLLGLYMNSRNLIWTVWTRYVTHRPYTYRFGGNLNIQTIRLFHLMPYRHLRGLGLHGQQTTFFSNFVKSAHLTRWILAGSLKCLLDMLSGKEPCLRERFCFTLTIASRNAPAVPALLTKLSYGTV